MLFVISISDVDVAVVVAKTRVSDCMMSVPEEVFRVKVSEVVAVAPGDKETDGVSVPVVRVTDTDPGDTGLVGRSTPVE